MNQEQLQAINQEIIIHGIEGTAFQEYGHEIVLEGTKEFVVYAEQEISFPIEGSAYQTSEEVFLQHPLIAQIRDLVYGGMPVQAGRCVGHNQVLNGVEYHQGSETIVAVTDTVLILGKLRDMQDYHYDLGKAEFFYVERGRCVELYGTTLHYTPCQVEASGFATICILPEGTNTPIEHTNHPILTKKNKFFITHPTMTAKIAQGAKPYLIGDIVGIRI